MWPLPTLGNDTVAVSFAHNMVTFAWLQQSFDHKKVILKAYQRHCLQGRNGESLMLFNPTHVKHLLHAFLHRHNQQNAFIALSFDGSPIVESYVACATSTPTQEDFAIPHSSSFIWGYRYLYHNDAGQSVFYVYKVPQLLLLQYKLLLIATQCNIITMTTKAYALLLSYKAYCGATFRQTQFAHDMQHHDNVLDQLITPSMMHKVMSLSSSITLADELSYVATSYGLLISQRNVSL